VPPIHASEFIYINAIFSFGTLTLNFVFFLYFETEGNNTYKLDRQK